MNKTGFTAEEIDEFARRAQRGDSEAFAKLYDQFVDQIYRYVFFRVGAEDALDLTETVFLKVWENIGAYQCGKYYFSSWIYRIAHNLVVDHYRVGKEVLSLEPSVPDEKKDNNPVVVVERKLGQESLVKAIAKLKKKYQQVIVLKYINELENHEVARILKTSESNMRILKFRALKALKRIMASMNIRY